MDILNRREVVTKFFSTTKNPITEKELIEFIKGFDDASYSSLAIACGKALNVAVKIKDKIFEPSIIDATGV